jgi:hypothetical protein
MSEIKTPKSILTDAMLRAAEKKAAKADNTEKTVDPLTKKASLKTFARRAAVFTAVVAVVTFVSVKLIAIPVDEDETPEIETSSDN